MNCFFESKIESITDECMTNADFVSPGNLLMVVGQILQIRLLQTQAGMYA